MVVPIEAVKKEIAYTAAALRLTEEEFDTLLRGDDTDPDDDGIIGRETERVADAIDVHLGTETVTEDLSRPASVGDVYLPLPKRPVQSVDSVEINTDRVVGPTVSADDYWVEGTHLELKPEADRNRWPTERRAVTVEWTHGYPEGKIPEPIRGAIIGLVRSALQEIESDGINSESIGGQSVNYDHVNSTVAKHIGRAEQFNEPTFYGGVQVI